MRWLIVFLLAFALFNGLSHWLKKLGLGKLPGDFSFRIGQRDWYLPVTSSVILSVIALIIGAFI
jgi:hypothetical protein